VFEGSRIADSEFRYLDAGAYGAVFVNTSTMRIRKVAYKKPDVSDDHARNVFQSELDALKIAERSEILRSLIAAPITELRGARVLDRDGKDITGMFYSDLGYEAAFVPGQFVKIGTVTGDEQDRVRALFRAEGIYHTIDASVVLEGGNITRIIDFAVREVELSW
jgi:hypothetical protein